MVNSCTVCYNNSRKNKHISYFRYPKDPIRRNKWLKAVGREDLISKIVDDRTVSLYRICQEHFESNNIKWSYNKAIKYLHDHAFPTLNLSSNAGSDSSQCTTASTRKNKEIQMNNELPFNSHIFSNVVAVLESQTSDNIHSSSAISQRLYSDISTDVINERNNAEAKSTEDDSGLHNQVHDGNSCSNCKNNIIGFRYACVQCPDMELCGACEIQQAHATHYVLRVPERRPQWEVSRVMQLVREEFALRLTEILPEPEIRVKYEVDEGAGPDPLQADSRPHNANILEQSMLDINMVQEQHLNTKENYAGEIATLALDKDVSLTTVRGLTDPNPHPPAKRALEASTNAAPTQKRHIIDTECVPIPSASLSGRIQVTKTNVFSGQPVTASAHTGFSFEVFTHSAQSDNDKHSEPIETYKITAVKKSH